MSFLDVNSYDEGNAQETVDFHEGECVRFNAVDEAFKVGPKINWTDSLICHLSSLDDEYCCVIPYRLLVELVQSGALVKAA